MKSAMNMFSAYVIFPEARYYALKRQIYFDYCRVFNPLWHLYKIKYSDCRKVGLSCAKEFLCLR